MRNCSKVCGPELWIQIIAIALDMWHVYGEVYFRIIGIIHSNSWSPTNKLCVSSNLFLLDNFSVNHELDLLAPMAPVATRWQVHFGGQPREHAEGGVGIS